MTQEYSSQLQDRFNLRLPDGMKDAIAERAKENGRSINSEIVQAIEFYLSEFDEEKINHDALSKLKYEIVSELKKQFTITDK